MIKVFVLIGLLCSSAFAKNELKFELKSTAESFTISEESYNFADFAKQGYLTANKEANRLFRLHCLERTRGLCTKTAITRFLVQSDENGEPSVLIQSRQLAKIAYVGFAYSTIRNKFIENYIQTVLDNSTLSREEVEKELTADLKDIFSSVQARIVDGTRNQESQVLPEVYNALEKTLFEDMSVEGDQKQLELLHLRATLDAIEILELLGLR